MPCIVSILVTTCPVRRQWRRRCKNLKVISKKKARVFHHVSPGVTEQDSGPSQLCHSLFQEGQVELTFLLSGASSEHQLVCVCGGRQLSRCCIQQHIFWIHGLSSFPRVCEAEESENTLPNTELYSSLDSHVHLIYTRARNI